MNKLILGLLFSGFITLNLQAGLVNAIALIVNETPITIYDINKEMETNKISKNDAVSRLIDKILYDQSIKENGISVDIFDVDNYIEKLAATNNMNVLDFKSLVRQQQDYEKFRENIKKQLLHQKLVNKIARGKLKIATDEDLKIYYQNNKEQFKIADTIDVVAYVSKSKALLNQLKKNPMLSDDKIVSQSLTFKQSELNAQTKYIINTTKENQFSAIFAQNQNYNMFYIKEKKDITVLKFENVKEQIFQVVMKKREQDALNEYFETGKLTADIKILR